MPFDWSEYLTLAKSVQGDVSATLAYKRTAITRAYYATFHRAAVYAENCNRKKDQRLRGEHTAVQVWFKSQRASVPHQDIGHRLANLHSLRKQCDYSDRDDLDLAKLLTYAINEADEICTFLNASVCPPVPPPLVQKPSRKLEG